MVRRFFPAARRDIDSAGFAARRECFAREDQIDAQPFIATQATGPIIPPREGLRWLYEASEDVAETEIEQALQPLSLINAA